MKLSEEDRAAAAGMQPGAITARGFLGADGRALPDIVAADEEAAAAAGLDLGQAADRLEALAKAGEAGLGQGVTVEGRYLVRSEESRGKLPCPWRCGLYHKNAVSVTRIDSGESLSFSELSLHLLREHHFCQGEGSPYRLAPAALKRLLEP